ncbi:MAG TPA: hypothetical protein VF559_07820 [Caulobacteraceae bacterium]|jgi:invasion protein IalB
MNAIYGAISAAAVLALAGQAAAQSAAAPAAPAAPARAVKAKNDPNRMVCKTIPVTGTRFTKSTCRTKQEWDDKAARDKQDLINEQTRGQLQRESG